EDKLGNLWLWRRDTGLLRVSADLKVQPVPSTGSPIGVDARRLAIDPLDGTLWLGSFAGGVINLANGAVRASYSTADGLGKVAVTDLRVAADGSIWAATGGGLSRIRAGRIATLNARTGLPCDGVLASIADDEGSTWVYTVCGLVRIPGSDIDSWIAAVDQGKP